MLHLISPDKEHKNSKKKIISIAAVCTATVAAAIAVPAFIKHQDVPTQKTDTVSSVSTNEESGSTLQIDTSSDTSTSSEESSKTASSKEAYSSSKVSSNITSSKSSQTAESVTVSSKAAKKSDSSVSNSISSRTEKVTSSISVTSREEKTDTSSSVTELPFVPYSPASSSQEPIKNEPESDSNYYSDENETPILRIEEIVPDDEYIYNNGEYSAEIAEKDNDSEIKTTVKITLENDKIVNIDVNADGSDESQLDSVKKEVIPKIMEKEGSELDSIDNIENAPDAAFLSECVKKAVKKALDQAKK